MTRHVRLEGVSIASTFRARLTGLMGKRDLSHIALWIPRCSSVHTFFMRSEIDLVFLDEDLTIVAIHEHARPWRLFFGGRRTDSILELSAGRAELMLLLPGDQLEWPE